MAPKALIVHSIIMDVTVRKYLHTQLSVTCRLRRKCSAGIMTRDRLTG